MPSFVPLLQRARPRLTAALLALSALSTLSGCASLL